MAGLETVFASLVRGNRLSAYMGLRYVMPDPVTGRQPAPVYGPSYSYVQLAASHLLTADGEPVTEGKRNQYVRLVPEAMVRLRGGTYQLLISANPQLHEYGSLSDLRLVDKMSEEEYPVVHLQLRRDLDVSKLAYAVRLYLIP